MGIKKMIKNTELSTNIDPNNITQYFTDKGFVRIQPNMVIPADIVVNHMGEDIRRRLLVAPSPDGKEYCLRPDFTLPLVLERIMNNKLDTMKYVYDGFAFRFPTSRELSRTCPEFRQIGIEDFGSKDYLETDISVLKYTLNALDKVNFSDYKLLLGDVSIFYYLLDQLKVSASYKDKIKRLFWRGSNFVISNINNNYHVVTDANKRILSEMKNRKDDSANKDLINRVSGFDKLNVFGGRNTEDIINSYIEKKEIIDTQVIDKKIPSMLSEFLSITCPASLALENLTSFAKSYNLDLEQKIESLYRRFELLNKYGLLLNETIFKTSLGRRIEYYTGLVFEIRSNTIEDLGPIAIGGRYDNFFTDLGSSIKIPAVGCSIYIDRLLMAGDNHV
jgi:ATP phosphoribosyltransferase regulatory subunit